MNHSSAENNVEICLLSKLVIQGYNGDFSAPLANLDDLQNTVEELAGFSEERFGDLIALADLHHVTVRALRVLQQVAQQTHRKRLHEWCAGRLIGERNRISKAVEWLYAIVQALQLSGCQVIVIKSLDHWPDLGSDFDLYTNGSPEHVVRVMKEKLHARVEPRSWGDRLANKWNFNVPGLEKLVEIHIRYLGQTGEQKQLAERVLERSVTTVVNGRNFPVARPEERILVSTLQRMYRHFYFRLCDMADTAALLQCGAVDFDELRRGAQVGGIWPGVATFIAIVSRYVEQFGRSIDLPHDVLESGHSPDAQVRFRDNFLRVPIRPAAGLFGSQLLNASLRFDLRALSRLPLLPPLAMSALLAYRLTGSDKGVW